MSEVAPQPFESWETLIGQARSLLAGERDRIANAANLASLIYHTLDRVNWAGFYFVDGDELIVGPFHGLPACVRIARGRGVCGTAWATGQTQRIVDVDAFSDHIACDAASRSEIVVPIRVRSDIIGVLDIDSPVPDRFSEADQRGFETLAALYAESLGG